MKWESIYGEYFSEYAKNFEILLSLNKSTYGMTNSMKLFADELSNWLIDQAGFKQSQCKTFIYYKYAPYGPKLVVLSYVDDCVY